MKKSVSQQSVRDRVRKLSIPGHSSPGSPKAGAEHFHTPDRVKMCNELSPLNPLNAKVASFFPDPVPAKNAIGDMNNNALPAHLLVIAPTRDAKRARKAANKGKPPPLTYQAMSIEDIRKLVKKLPLEEQKKILTHIFESHEELKQKETSDLQQEHREERCADINEVDLDELWNNASATKNAEKLKNAIRTVKEAEHDLRLAKQKAQGRGAQTISNKRIKVTMSALTGEGQKSSALAQPLDEEDLPSFKLGPELEPAAQAASDPISEALVGALTEALAADNRAALEIMRDLGYNLKKDGEKYLMDTVQMLAGAGAEAEAGAAAAASAPEDN